MSAKILTLEVTGNVELKQAEKRKRKEEKMLKKTSLSQIQMMKKWRKALSISLNSSFVLNVPQMFWKEPTMEIPFAKSIKKPSLIINVDSVVALLSFSVLARTTSVILAIAKLGRSETRLRKILNNAKVKMIAR
jgi:hypothetical protein